MIAKYVPCGSGICELIGSRKIYLSARAFSRSEDIAAVLAGVRLVISDAHEGLKAAIGSVFAGAAWQRCRVHFLRNILTRIPRGNAEMVAAAVRTIFAQPDAEHVHSQLDMIATMLGRQFPPVEAMLHDAKDDILAFTSFPVAHWKKIWSTNPLVILSQLQGVVDVADGLDRSPIVRAGRAYLQPSSRHGRGRFGVRCSSGGVRLAA